MLQKNTLTTWPITENFLYAPLVAHEKGIQYLKTPHGIRPMYPKLIVAAVELLTEENETFSEKANFFKDGQNDHINAKEFYIKLLRKYNISAPPPTGYGELELCYVFYRAIPDNCLPILWHKQPGWVPLFDMR